MRGLPALFVAAGLLLVGLVLTGCTAAAPPGPKIDPALAGLIPSDTVLMIGARVEAIQKTPLYQKYLANRSFPLVDQFGAETKVNVQKDLWELLYVSNGKRGALIGHGMFSDEGEPKLQKKGDNRFGYKGFTFVGSEDNAILLINQTVVAVGDTNQLRAMVDAHEKSAGPPPAMAALLGRMPATAQLWMAYGGGGSTELPFDAKGNLANVNKILSLIQAGTLYLEANTGLTGLAEGTSGSDEDAEQLEGGLKALIGFGRLSAPQNQPEAQRMWDGLRPTREVREVKLHIDEPQELLDKLVTMLIGRPGKGQ